MWQRIACNPQPMYYLFFNTCITSIQGGPKSTAEEYITLMQLFKIMLKWFSKKCSQHSSHHQHYCHLNGCFLDVPVLQVVSSLWVISRYSRRDDSAKVLRSARHGIGNFGRSTLGLVLKRIFVCKWHSFLHVVSLLVTQTTASKALNNTQKHKKRVISHFT